MAEENKEYPCPNCDTDKPAYREPCPDCDYIDKGIGGKKEK